MSQTATKPTQQELERAHQCMQTLLNGLRMARQHGGKNAKAHVGDLIDVIEAFKLGDVGLNESARHIQGPFLPEGVQ